MKETAAERVASLEGRFYSLTKGFGKDRISTFQSLFVSENSYEISLSRRSLTRGLGLSVKEGTLRRCKLWARELFYLKSDLEPPLPYNMELMRVGLPEGYKQVSRHSVNDFDREVGQALFNAEMVERAWTQPVVRQDVQEEWLRKLHQGVSPWDLCRLIKPKLLNLLKLTRSQARNWLFRGDERLFGRCRFTRGKGVWVVDVSLYDQPSVCVQEEEGKVGLVVDLDRGDRIEVTSEHPKGVIRAFNGLEPLPESCVRVFFAPPQFYGTSCASHLDD